jgi:hypothetical protein
MVLLIDVVRCGLAAVRGTAPRTSGYSSQLEVETKVNCGAKHSDSQKASPKKLEDEADHGRLDRRGFWPDFIFTLWHGFFTPHPTPLSQGARLMPASPRSPPLQHLDWTPFRTLNSVTVTLNFKPLARHSLLCLSMCWGPNPL